MTLMTGEERHQPFLPLYPVSLGHRFWSSVAVEMGKGEVRLEKQNKNIEKGSMLPCLGQFPSMPHGVG
jgi:hypothetical protein